MFNSIDTYLSDQEIKDITNVGSPDEQLLEHHYSWFLSSPPKYSPSIYNHNLRISFEKELMKIRNEISNGTVVQGKFKVSAALDQINLDKNLVELTTQSEDRVSILKSLDINKLNYLIYKKKEHSIEAYLKAQDQKSLLLNLLIAIVEEPILPWPLWNDNMQLEENDNYSITNVPDTRELLDLTGETVFINFVRVHFSKIKNDLRSSFIVSHTKEYISALENIRDQLDNLDVQISLNNTTNEINYEVKHYHICLVVYLFLELNEITVSEHEEDIINLFRHISDRNLEINKGEVLDNRKRKLSISDGIAIMVAPLLIELLENRYTKRDINPETVKTWMKTSKKNGSFFNFPLRKKEDDVVFRSKPDKGSTYKNAVNQVVDRLSLKFRTQLQSQFAIFLNKIKKIL